MCCRLAQLTPLSVCQFSRVCSALQKQMERHSDIKLRHYLTRIPQVPPASFQVTAAPALPCCIPSCLRGGLDCTFLYLEPCVATSLSHVWLQ